MTTTDLLAIIKMLRTGAQDISQPHQRVIIPGSSDSNPSVIVQGNYLLVFAKELQDAANKLEGLIPVHPIEAIGE